MRAHPPWRRERPRESSSSIAAWAGPRFGGPVYLDLPPPVIRIPRERYILDADRADPAAIYGVLAEPPVEVIDQPYTLEQVRFNAPLRDRMPRIDLDINFDLGSWQLTPDQIDRLGSIADAINRMLSSATSARGVHDRGLHRRHRQS